MVVNSNRLDPFFEDQALFGRYRGVAVIMALTGLSWALQPVAIFYALETGADVSIQNALAADWIIRFISPFFLWFVFWLAFALIVKLLGGKLRYGRLFKLVGWGFAPMILTGITRAVGRYYAFKGASLPRPVRRGEMFSEFEGYRELVAQFHGDPVIVGTTLASCTFVAFSAYFWLYAVKYSSTINRRQRFIVVSIPALCYVGYSLLETYQILFYM